ncbi:hypothetical protein ACFWR9_41785 [Streptomyces sp. NPDC058534]|uniref:hypothetical protein n=1 Tax=Streptomyces sp. NPDC058534 TaxID=3346541 RepID=UPI003662A571
MSPLRSLRRIMEPGTGRHRLTVPERITVPLNDLLGPPWPAPSRPYGAAVTQCWDDCPRCGTATAGVLTKDGRTCGECLKTSPAQAVTR